LIQKVWTEHQYLVDPHTACAFKNLSLTDRAVILATAHPAKFPQVFEQAGLGKPTSPVLDALLDQSPQKYKISVDSGAVRSFIEKKLKPA
jgi:threonine synthase